MGGDDLHEEWRIAEGSEEPEKNVGESEWEPGGKGVEDFQ